MSIHWYKMDQSLDKDKYTLDRFTVSPDSWEAGKSIYTNHIQDHIQSLNTHPYHITKYLNNDRNIIIQPTTFTKQIKHTPVNSNSIVSLDSKHVLPKTMDRPKKKKHKKNKHKDKHKDKHKHKHKKKKGTGEKHYL